MPVSMTDIHVRPEQRMSAVDDAEGVVQSDERARAWHALASWPAGHPSRLAARNELVALHMPLVHYLAERYRGRGETLEDLVQVGAVGLIKSVDRYDPLRGVAFSTFATPTILGEIKRHFRDKTWLVRVPRHLKDLRTHLVTAREDLSHELMRSPTVTELAARLGLTEEEVLEALDASNAYSATSLDAPGGENGRSTGMALEDQLGESDHGLDLVEMRHCVAPLLDALPERQRKIIFLRFFRDKTQVEIAGELGISQMHVSRLLSQTLSRLHDQVLAEAKAS
jgi:RNA polymerase sigma-B factor